MPRYMQYMVESQEVMDVLQILRRVREALIYLSFRRKPESSFWIPTFVGMTNKIVGMTIQKSSKVTKRVSQVG